METLFENKYIRDEKIMKEVYQYFYFKRPLYRVIDTVAGLLFIANLLVWILGDKINFVVLAVVPIFILVRFLMYRGAVDMLLKKDKDMYKSKSIKVQNIVTAGSIKTVIFKDTNKITYSKIKHAIKTKHLIVVCAQNNAMYVFEQDSFTKGTKEEFVAFLKEKGIKVKSGK